MRIGLHEPQQRARQHGLAGTRFAHHREALARAHGEGNIVQDCGALSPSSLSKLDPEMLHLEDRGL